MAAPVTPAEQEDLAIKSLGATPAQEAAPADMPNDFGATPATPAEQEDQAIKSLGATPAQEISSSEASRADVPNEMFDRPGPIEAAISGLAHGRTLGLADEFTSAIGALKDKAQGTPVTLEQAYGVWEKLLSKHDKEVKDANPKTYAATEMLGTLANPIVGEAAAAGSIPGMAGVGAIQHIGESDIGSDKTPKNMDEFKHFMAHLGLASAIAGGSQGAFNIAEPVLKPAAQAIADKAEAIPNLLERLANRKALKSGFGNAVAPWKEANGKGITDELGQFMRDEGIVTFGASASTIAERAAEVKGRGWDKMSGLFHKADATGNNFVSGKAIADKIIDMAMENSAPGNEAITNRLIKIASKYESMGDISFSEAQRLKNTYQWKFGDPSSMPIGQRLTNGINDAIGEEMLAGAGRFQPEGSAELQEGRKFYGFGKMMEKAAEVLSARQEKNQTFGLGEKNLMAGAYAGLKAGKDLLAGPKAIAVGAASHFLKGRGDSMAAGALGQAAEEAHTLIAKSMLASARVPGLAVPLVEMLKNPTKAPKLMGHIFSQPLGPGETRNDTIHDPEAVGEMLSAIKDSDMDSVTKTRLMSKIHDDQSFDLQVSGPPAPKMVAKPNMPTIQSAVDLMRSSMGK